MVKNVNNRVFFSYVYGPLTRNQTSCSVPSQCQGINTFDDDADNAGRPSIILLLLLNRFTSMTPQNLCIAKARALNQEVSRAAESVEHAYKKINF